MKPIHQRLTGRIARASLLITAVNTAMASTASINDAKTKQVLDAM